MPLTGRFIARRRSSMDRSDHPRLPGFHPSERPWPDEPAVNRTSDWLLPWASPFLGLPTGRLEPDFRPASSHALGIAAVALTTAILHLRVSISDRLTRSYLARTRPRGQDRTALLRFVRHANPDHSSHSRSGLWVHLADRRSSLSRCPAPETARGSPAVAVGIRL
jgi:hypothetical protein